MNARRLIFPIAFIAMAVCLRLSFPSYAMAAWNPAGESGVVIYEVVPEEKLIHVRYIYTITNWDTQTLADNSYYYAWPVYIPINAVNINIGFTQLGVQGIGQYKIIKIPLVKQLTYGQTESFVISYDLKTDSPNNIKFTALGDTYKVNIQIMLPKGYFNQVWLDKTATTKEETQNKTIYKYVVVNNGSDFSVLVELFRKASILSLSSTIKLAERDVSLNINYFEGELDKARNIQSLVNQFFPHLERIIGVPLPQEYPVLITQSTNRQINKWAGINAGEKGIFMPFEGDGLRETLLHEMSHYWARIPPFEEAWMREGQAELYAYLTLGDLGFYDEAIKMLKINQQFYAQNKNKFSLPLAELIIPQTITDENSVFIGFAYTKSFLFMLKLYESLGLEYIRKANREVFSSKQTINWFEYLNTLENVSGQNLKMLFSEWILPHEFSRNYEKWLSLQNSYKELYSIVLKSKGSLGIQVIEGELQLLANLITQGQFSAAESKAQELRINYAQWALAIKNYSEAERIVFQSRGYLGIEPVNKELNTGRELLLSGKYSQALAKIEATLKLYQQWQSAEKKYRETYIMISPDSGATGIAPVNKELEAARELLLAGQYDKVSLTVEVVLALYGQWQNAVKVYRETESIISPYKTSLGIAPVLAELKNAETLLIEGQYGLISVRTESALALFEQWQKAVQNYQSAQRIISPFRESPGIAAVNLELKVAEDLLLSGKYGMVSVKVESALTLFELWKNAEKSYRDADSMLSTYRGAPGMIKVIEGLKAARDLLEKGQYAGVNGQIQSTLKLYKQWQEVYKVYENTVEVVAKNRGLPGISVLESGLAFAEASLRSGDLNKADTDIQTAARSLKKWESVYNLYLDASKSVLLAEKENRTWGLQKAKDAVLEGESLLKTGSLDESKVKLEKAVNEANKAVTPFKALVGPMAIALSFIIAITAALLFVHRRTIRKNTVEA